MSNKPQQKPADRVKKMTKYDRKLEAKKRQAEKEQKNKARALMVTILICLCIVGAIIISIITSAQKKKSVLNDPYIKIGSHDITQLEYAFYYSYTVNNYINYYTSIGLISYLGIDTSKDLALQPYNENMSWKDYFEQLTVEQIQMVKMLLDDAKRDGFTYDSLSDYDNFKASMRSNAADAEMSTADYYKAMYGNYATEKNIKQLVMDEYFTNAYNAELLERNKPSDEEVSTYYEENKDEYDTVDYRSFTISAQLGDDPTDEEIADAMAELKEKAEEMKNRRESGENFRDLCIDYAPEEDLEDYEDEEEDYSLSEGYIKSYTSSLYSDWLFDEERQNGELTIVEDPDNHEYHVVEFIQRNNDEENLETISSQLANERVNEYFDGLKSSYEVVDIKAGLVYLTLDLEEDESEEDESEE